MIETRECWVDLAYQRPETHLIRRIADDFRHEQFAAILVSEREGPDGRYAVIDGQQRLGAARLLGITHIPALVANTKTQAAEAALFVATQRERLNVRPAHRFRAEVVAGAPRALEIDALIKAHGLTLGESSGVREAPDAFAAIGTTEQMHDRFGIEVLATTFDVLVSAFPGMPGRWRGEFIAAIATFIAQDKPDLGRLIETLADDRPNRLGSPNVLYARSTDLRKGRGAGGGSWTYTVDVIRDDYRKRRPRRSRSREQ